jgi:aryl-alcohol dehydrogenase-like predicted oxidoreductase
MQEAFAMLEQAVKQGIVRFYGIATWAGLRVQEGSRDYLSLFELADLAREAGGEQHHFRFIQLPFSLAMPEAYALLNQTNEREKMSVLTAAARLGIAVMGSATLQQANLIHGLPVFIARVLGMKTDVENAIQFSRSAPGLTTALVGMGHKEHVTENLKPALLPTAKVEDWLKLFVEHEA